MIGERLRAGEEHGFSLVELLVAMSIGIIVLFGAVSIIQGSVRSSNRTTARVLADQAVRPVLSRIVDELHSSCIEVNAAPVRVGSSGSSISFTHQTGSAVSPVPVLRKITLSSGTLSESVYANTGGTAPSWTFATTPASTVQRLTSVGPATIGGAVVPLFRYYAYDAGGLISSTPLATPLSAANAAKVVKVDIALAAVPAKTTVEADTAAAVSLSDSVLLRFSPADTAGTENLPCV